VLGFQYVNCESDILQIKPEHHELEYSLSQITMAPAVAGPGDGIIERVVAADKVRWWNKPNLRRLYLLLVPFCFFIESTSGFDSSMMNGSK
jgi:hypothetical protein